MTRAEAAKKLMKLWGPRALWRIGDRQSSPEQRLEQREQRRAAQAKREEVRAEIQRRLNECEWYLELRRQEAEASKAITKADHTEYYKFTIGYRDKIVGFFHIEGEGDTWEEAFKQAEWKRRRETVEAK